MLQKSPINFDVESHKTIFNLIFKHKKISAANLARITGMQKSSLLYITRALEERELIRVHTKAFKTKERGRPSTLYEVNPELYNILGVEIIPGELRIIITDFQGKILNKIKFSYNFADSKDLSEKIKSQLKDWSISENNLLGIGLAIPGIINSESGEIVSSKPLNLTSYPIQEKLQQCFKVPIVINNDAKAGASGTYLLSKSKELSWEYILFYSISLHFSGIGLGIIIDGKQYLGTNGQSGEIFESLPSIKNLCNEFDISEEEFYNADKGEVTPQLERLYNSLKCIIGQLIVNTSQLLNPDYFEIGGDVTSYKNFFKNYLTPEIKRIQKEQYRSENEAPTFNSSDYEEFSNSLGAAASILQTILC